MPDREGKLPASARAERPQAYRARRVIGDFFRAPTSRQGPRLESFADSRDACRYPRSGPGAAVRVVAVATSNSSNLMLELPAFTTRMFQPCSGPDRLRRPSLCARSIATAQDAMRVRTLSARDVRIIGTLAPSTIPAASASERKVRFLASMLPASRSGTTRIWACPATRRLDALDACCGRADGIVECKRSIQHARR